jgi:hypothetical protein
MFTFITTTADAQCVSIHQTLDEAREYAEKLGATRIFAHDRDGKPAFKRNSRKLILTNVNEVKA